MRVLVIEDDINIFNAISLALTNKGFVLEHSDTGEYSLELIDSYDYDIILLDLMLPDIDGLEILKYIRTNKPNFPVLILSGLTDTDKKVDGFNIGADDYLTKPFAPKELIARIQAVIRRTKGFPDSKINIGKLELNITDRTVKIGDTQVHLTVKEYLILELLSLRKGKVLSKEIFLNHLYDGTNEPDMKTIDVFVCKLRKKLSKYLGETNYIHTVWGQGYILEDRG